MNAVARRKIALVFVMLFLSVLLLSPWASAPSPSMSDRTEATGETPSPSLSLTPAEMPEAPVKPVKLKVAAALPPAEFTALRLQSEEQASKLPGITVEYQRIEPDDAYDAYLGASRIGEAADVMLLENEWVKTFAVSGYLIPADSAFVGEALSEQFEALIAPLKWNGYLWGVPRDYDPYVIVWNVPLWKSLVDSTELKSPQSVEEWEQLATRTTEQFPQLRWLAISSSDPFALLTWLQTAGGTSVALDEADAVAWQDTPSTEALALLERERSGVAFVNDSNHMAAVFSEGSVLAALMPYSDAQALAAKPLAEQPAELVFDHVTWQHSPVWPRGRSFVISSRTASEEAARRWISVMTESALQRENHASFGKLPVYRSLYADLDPSGLSTLIPSDEEAANAFPYRPQSDNGPDLPDRLQRIGALWSEFASGGVDTASWAQRWGQTLADAKFNN